MTAHPAWCDVAQCTAEPGHLHYSRAIYVAAPPDNPDVARFILVVYGDGDAAPLLEFSAMPVSHPAIVSTVLEVGVRQARQLHAAFGAALTVMAADDPNATALPEVAV